MKWFWCVFFMIWPILAVVLCLVAPSQGWWFPSESVNPLGRRIDHLFYVILWITTAVFILTQVGLGYALFMGAKKSEAGSTEKAWYSHGRHELEVAWSVIPAIVLLFIALYQLDVWAEYRVTDAFPRKEMEGVLTRLNQKRSPRDSLALAEVSGRQFEWRIRYPGFDAQGNLLPLMPEPQPTDLYSVNELRLPSGHPVMINLRSEDVQHSFFVPDLRVKQDAVPGLVIPVWFATDHPGEHPLMCAELCGWGHYKMYARLITQSEEDFLAFLKSLQRAQNFDGVPEQAGQDAGN